jgi:2-polyprenyl-6-methoxyphenol hydroxylase-like FAD-dependent oxidoreductase
MVATDVLVRLFSNQQPLLLWFRSRVLELLKASALLRKFSLKLASGAWTN